MKRLVPLLAVPLAYAHDAGGEIVEHTSMTEGIWHYLSTNGVWIFGAVFLVVAFFFVWWLLKEL